VDITHAERQREALRLRKGGATYEDISRALGLGSTAAAHGLVRYALHKVIREPAEQVLRLELQRYDALLAGLWAKAEAGNEDAVETCLRVMSARQKLLGIDAPTKLQIQADVSAQALPGLPPDLLHEVRQLSPERRHEILRAIARSMEQIVKAAVARDGASPPDAPSSVPVLEAEGADDLDPLDEPAAREGVEP
jgi:hypothetical protein